MNSYLILAFIFVILLVLELAYFKIADKFNIIDKPNERSSHSMIVLRGGGIIFLLSLWIWSMFASTGIVGASVLYATGCAVRGNDNDVLPVGYSSLGYVVGCNPGIDRVRGSIECHQLYGWGKWHYWSIYDGFIAATCYLEQFHGLCRSESHLCGNYCGHSILSV